MQVEKSRSLAVAAVICACVIYVYPLSLPTPLLDPDEGLHAAIAQEMLEHDDWVVPTFLGEPFLDKPVFYFWTQVVSLSLFGMTEAAVRLPGLLFGLLGALTTGLLATRLFDRRTGAIACLISMTLMIPMALAQAAAHDVALVPWTNLALLCLWETDHASTKSRKGGFIATTAACFALAILTKGLIGVAIVAVAYGLYVVFSRQLSVLIVARCLGTLGLGAVLASPWYIAMEQRRPGYLYYYFIERHVMGYTTQTQRHGGEPWHYYIPLLLLGGLPWIWYLIPLARQKWADRREQVRSSASMIFATAWLVGGFLFLSMAKSKLVTYLLPVFPALSILCAVAWVGFLRNELRPPVLKQFLALARGGVVSGIFIPPIALFGVGAVLSIEIPWQAWLASAAASGLSFYAWRLFQQQRHVESFACGNVWVALLFLTIMTWPLQQVAEQFSERALSRWIQRQGEVPHQVILVGQRPASVVFYLDPATRQSLQPGQFQEYSLSDFPLDRTALQGALLAITDEKVERADELKLSVPGQQQATAGIYHVFKLPRRDKSPVQTATRPAAGPE